jgi:type III secretory pathway component EscU
LVQINRIFHNNRDITFYISALALWWLIDFYAAYIFEPYLFGKKKFLVKIAVLFLSAIFSLIWVLVVVSVSSEISKTGAF